MAFKKTCSVCVQTFFASGPAGKYCSGCSLVKQEEAKQKNRERAERRRRAEGRRIGRGAPRGEAHPNYKHGFYVAQTQSREYREKVRYCERCSIDTFSLSRWHWVMHHKDHNHANHKEDNLELLCKRCHALEHEVINNIKEGATTIPSGSRAKQPEAPDIHKDDDIV